MNKIICKACGAEFDASNPNCPYCGSTNLSGAETEYLKKLDGIKENLDDLNDYHLNETKKQFKAQGTKLIAMIVLPITLIIFVMLLIVIFQDINNKIIAENNYIKLLEYQNETYPKLDEAYEKGDANTLVQIEKDAREEDIKIKSWDHYGWYSLYEHVKTIERHKENLKDEDASEWEKSFSHNETLRSQIALIKYAYSNDLKIKKELQLFEEDIKNAKDALKSFWKMSDEEIDKLIQKLKDNELEYEWSRNYVEKFLNGGSDEV